MVASQIAARGVRDPRVLAAMEKVPRHLFVPEALRAGAYADEPLPIGEGQTISQPYIVAYMTERSGSEGGRRSSRSGRAPDTRPPILAEIAGEVFTVEIVGRSPCRARQILGALGYANIRFRVGDGAKGWPEEAPFDAIMVTAAAAAVPRALEDQLGRSGVDGRPGRD